MTGEWGPGAFVAAVFALHPLHVESVAWAAERKDVLSGLFWMLTLGAWALYVERPGAARYLAAVAAFALGLMAKPMLVTLPFVLLLLDVWPFHRWRGLPDEPRAQRGSKHGVFPLVIEKGPFFALAAASCVITFLAQRSIGAVASSVNYPFPDRVANALVSCVRYLLKAILPFNLAVIYPYPDHWPVWQVCGAALVLTGITLAALAAVRRRPSFTVGWFWYLGTLVPVIGLIQVGRQSIADRYTYLPLIGVCIAAAWGARGLAQAYRLPRAVMAVSATLVLAFWSTLTFNQVGCWKNTNTLFEHALRATDENAVAHEVLGNYLASQKHFDEAAVHLREAMRIEPGNEAATSLGQALAAGGRYDEAITWYGEALRLYPGSAEAHLYLAEAYYRRGMKAKAVPHYAEGVGFKGCTAKMRTNYAACLLEGGRTEDAVAELRQAVRLDPTYPETRNNLGATLLLLGRNAEAAEELSRALALKADWPEARFNLGMALFRDGRFEAAAREFAELARLRPDDAAVRDALAAARARSGRGPGTD